MPPRRAPERAPRTARGGGRRGTRRGPAGAPRPRAGPRGWGSASRRSTAAPERRPGRSGSSSSRPSRSCSICSVMPPTALATTGRDFHIASVTVSPNPSARLFWTTTVAWRCSALMIAAFSSGSLIGTHARWMRPRDRVRQRRASARCTRRRPAPPRGRRRHPSTAGPTRTRWAPSEGSTWWAKPSITPAMSFIRSQREACTTSGACGRRRRAALEDVDVPVDPARRAVAARERDRPAASRRRRAGRRSRARAGRCARTSARSWPRTGRSTAGSRAPSRAARRVARTSAFETTSRSTCFDVGTDELPRALRPLVRLVAADVAAPHDRGAGALAAPRRGRRGCGSWIRTTSPGRTSAQQLVAVAAQDPLVVAVARRSPSGPPSPGEP